MQDKRPETLLLQSHLSIPILPKQSHLSIPILLERRDTSRISVNYNLVGRNIMRVREIG